MTNRLAPVAAQAANLAEVGIAWGVARRREHRRGEPYRSGHGRVGSVPNDQVALADGIRASGSLDNVVLRPRCPRGGMPHATPRNGKTTGVARSVRMVARLGP